MTCRGNNKTIIDKQEKALHWQRLFLSHYGCNRLSGIFIHAALAIDGKAKHAESE